MYTVTCRLRPRNNMTTKQHDNETTCPRNNMTTKQHDHGTKITRKYVLTLTLIKPTSVFVVEFAINFSNYVVPETRLNIFTIL